MVRTQNPHDGRTIEGIAVRPFARTARLGIALTLLSLAPPACSPCVSSDGSDSFADAGTLTASGHAFPARGTFGFARGLHLDVASADTTAPSDAQFQILCPMSTDDLQPGVYDLASVCPNAGASQVDAAMPMKVTSLTGQLTVTEVSGVIDETSAHAGDSGHFRGSIDITASVENQDGSNPQTWSAHGVALVGDWNYQATSCDYRL